MKLFRLVVFSLIGACLLSGCSYGQEQENKEEELMLPNIEGVEMLEDNFFLQGLNLRRLHSQDKQTPMIIRRLDLMGTAQKEDSVWTIAQWDCRNNFVEATERQEGDNYIYEDESKKVIVNNKEPSVYLECNASLEYDAPRQQGQTWPHLLLSQDFQKRYWIKDYSNIYVQMIIEFEKFEDKMLPEDFNPSLHAAQLQWFFTVQNHNRENDQYGDYLWLGVPIFDNRKEFPGNTQSQDKGQGDKVGTNKFIYSIDSRAYLQETMTPGKKVAITYDILPSIKNAFEAAQGKNFLTATSFEELSFGSTNFGWELPGIYDVGVKLKDLRLTGVLKNNSEGGNL